MQLLKKTQKKPHKLIKINKNSNLSKSVCGTFYVKSLENCNLTSKQIESFRRTLIKDLKKTIKIWIRIKPNKGLTCKLGDKRMGKGKGEYSLSIFKVYVGTVLFEVEGHNVKLIDMCLKIAKKKLPIKSKIYQV